MGVLDRVKSILTQGRERWMDPMGWSFANWDRGIDPRNQHLLIQAFEHYVARCISLIAYTVIDTPLRLYVIKDPGTTRSMNFRTKALTDSQRANLWKDYISKGYDEIEEVTDPDHPFNILMTQVNPDMNEADLKIYMMQHLEMIGNHYWKLVYDERDQIPIEIYPLQSDNVTVKLGESGRYYEYIEGAGIVRYGADEIIHFFYPSSDNLVYGKGTLQTAIDSHNISKNMRRLIQATFVNDAVLGGIFTVKGKTTDESFKRTEQQLRQAYSGIRKHRKLAVLTDDIDYQSISLNPRDLEYVQGMEAMRDEIAGLFGVPKSFLTTDDVNRANAESNLVQLAKFTVKPKLTLIEQKLNEKLIPLFDDRLFVKFDNPVPDDNEYRLKERATHIAIGYTTINEERQKEGLEPVSWGDVPMSMQSQSQVPQAVQEAVKDVLKKNGSTRHISDLIVESLLMRTE